MSHCLMKQAVVLIKTYSLGNQILLYLQIQLQKYTSSVSKKFGEWSDISTATWARCAHMHMAIQRYVYIAGMCLQKVLFLKIVSHVSCIFVNQKGNQNPNISHLLRCCTATPQCKPKISHIRTLSDPQKPNPKLK